MLGFKNFLMEEDGVGVVEMVLIVVVLIGIVVLFKKKLTTFLIFSTQLKNAQGRYSEEKGEYYCVCSPFTDAGGAASFHTFRSSETL